MVAVAVTILVETSRTTKAISKLKKKTINLGCSLLGALCHWIQISEVWLKKYTWKDDCNLNHHPYHHIWKVSRGGKIGTRLALWCFVSQHVEMGRL